MCFDINVNFEICLKIIIIKGYVYVTTNKNFTVLYIGATKDLKKRIECHKNGTGAIFTKKYNATILIYFEEFDDNKDAFARKSN